MTMTKETEIGDAEFRALLAAEVQILANYLVGFALPTSENGSLDALQGGSGTLVSINGAEGVLTAKHVLTSLGRNKVAGLILPSPGSPELHRVTFSMEHARQFTLPAGEPEPCGPDIAFLIPPPDVLGTLRAKRSFYSLSKRQTEMLAKPTPLDHGLWVLSGFSGEWTTDGAPERGFERIKIFRGGLGEGKVTKEFERGGFDYLIFEALYNQLYEGPKRFGGFSGGGLWQLLGREVDGKFEITQRLLLGVAFYELDFNKEDDRVTRDITCHGRRSVYQTLFKDVQSSLHL